MRTLLDEIAEETMGKSYKTFRYEFEGTDYPKMDYDDQLNFTWQKYGETARITTTKNLKERADILLNSEPLFGAFLDGSRKIYKVDDMAYRGHVYPVLAGQVGVGCCTRVNKEMMPLFCGKDNEPMFKRDLVITLPSVAKPNDWVTSDVAFEALRNKINEREDFRPRGIEFAKILQYSTKVDPDEKMENKGVASIQDYMISQEQDMVARLVKNKYLGPDRFLLKDGPLEYRVHGIAKEELQKFKNNYQFVVGASKSFNPENCVDKNGKNNSNLIAELPLYSRTPVNMFSSEKIGNIKFAVWFVRIRDKKHTNNAFDGILKLEKILINDEQCENGIDTDEVDTITAHIINERNPVCYGVDNRWERHLYPIYVTERFIKSRYLSESMFMNFF